MAQRTILIDDIDGSEKEVNTVRFALDGTDYEIDLKSGNEAKLRAALDLYVKAGRPALWRPGKSSKKSGTKSETKVDVKSEKATHDLLQEIRAWAKEQGFEIADRGRVSKKIRDAYNARNRGVAA